MLDFDFFLASANENSGHIGNSVVKTHRQEMADTLYAEVHTIFLQIAGDHH